MLLMTVALVTFFPLAESFDNNEKAQIRSGLDTGKAIGEAMEKKLFKDSLEKIGKSIGGYLGMLGPFVSFVLGFIPGSESAELRYMKEMMTQIENRFDRIDSQLDDVKRLINWNPIRVKFGEIEQIIESMSMEFQHLYKGSTNYLNAAESRKEHFVSTYKADYHNSGYKLYRAIVSGGVFEIPLGDSIIDFTKYDRKKTQMFLFGIMQLLLQAAKVEIAYSQIQMQKI